MRGFAVYMEERLPFAWDLSLENSVAVSASIEISVKLKIGCRV